MPDITQGEVSAVDESGNISIVVPETTVTVTQDQLDQEITIQTNVVADLQKQLNSATANTTVAKIVSSTAYDLSAATTGAIGTQTFGPAVVALKSAKVTINANVEDQDVLGSLNPADFLNKEFSIEGSFECIWQNETDAKTAFMGPTPQAISLIATNTDVTINSSYHPIFNITLAKCTFQELGRPFKVKDLIYQTVKFKAVYSVSDTLLGEVILTNSLSTY